MLFSLFNRLRSSLKRRHHVRAHFWQSLANYTQTAGALAIGVVLARLLDPHVFGEYVSILATISFLMIPLSFSTAQILVSDAGRTPELFGRVMGTVVFITVLKFSLLIGYALWGAMSHHLQYAAVIFLAGIPLASADWLGVIRSDLEGRNYFRPNFFVQISSLLAGGTCTITTVLIGWGVFGLAFGGLVSFSCQLVIYLRATDRTVGLTSFDRCIFREQFASGFWIWLIQIAEGWFTRIDKIALGHFGGLEQLGFYNRAFNYAPISHLALNSLMTNATVVGLANQPTTRKRQILFKKTSIIVFIGAFLNWILWWQFSDPLVIWIFGQNWVGSIPAFEAFSWLSMSFAIMYLPSTILLSVHAYRELAICRFLGLITLAITLFSIKMTMTVSAANVAASFCIITTLTGALIGFRSWRYIK